MRTRTSGGVAGARRHDVSAPYADSGKSAAPPGQTPGLARRAGASHVPERMGTLLVIATLLSVLPPDEPLGLETVTPVVAGKNQVRWWEFDWQTVEIPTVDDAAPIELLFYEE